MPKERNISLCLWLLGTKRREGCGGCERTFFSGGIAGRGFVILHRRGLVGCVLEAELVHVAAALRLVVREPLAPLCHELIEPGNAQ